MYTSTRYYRMAAVPVVIPRERVSDRGMPIVWGGEMMSAFDQSIKAS